MSTLKAKGRVISAKCAVNRNLTALFRITGYILITKPTLTVLHHNVTNLTQRFGRSRFYQEIRVMEKELYTKQIETVQTTIGDLIEAITEIALEAGKSEAEGYQLASVTLESILRRNRKEIAIN